MSFRYKSLTLFFPVLIGAAAFLQALELPRGLLLTGGTSRGTGSTYEAYLDELDKDFDTPLFTAGGGVFLEWPVTGAFTIRPELFFTLNRGFSLADSSDNHISYYTSRALEFYLMGDYILKKPQTRHLRFHLQAGPQYLYALNLVKNIKLGSQESDDSIDNLCPSSFGLSLGGEAEWAFRPVKQPSSLLFGLRTVLPLTDRLGYTNEDREELIYRTWELLLTLGVKFHDFR